MKLQKLKRRLQNQFLIVKLQPQRRYIQKEYLQQLHPNRFLAPSSAFEDFIQLHFRRRRPVIANKFKQLGGLGSEMLVISIAGSFKQPKNLISIGTWTLFQEDVF